MSDDLLQAAQRNLLPALEPLGFEVTESQTFDSFDNARVVLQNAELRICVIRERGQLGVDFGPPTEPGTWFDSDIIFEHLGLSSGSSFEGARAEDVLRGVAAFVVACRTELTRMFDVVHIADTKRELKILMERRAERLFGWKPPGDRTA